MTAPLPPALLFAAREQRLAALDTLARTLWLGALTHSQGELEPRLQALLTLRAQLVGDAAGETTAQPTPWPPPLIAQALAQTLAALDLQRLCRDQPALADTVLLSLLFHLDFIVDYQDRGASEAGAVQHALDAFAADWRERSDWMAELIQVFGQLPADCPSCRWDRLRGLLQSSDWQAVLRSHHLLLQLPELVRLLESLGRDSPSEQRDARTAPPQPRPQAAPATRLQPRTVRVPDLPGQTQGIQRADRIARMLPAESLLLGQPRLRLLWHARRAERTLLCYEDDDHLTELRTQPVPASVPRPGLPATPRLVKGPLLVCVDTSGSMQGGAEAVAKAVVLQALRLTQTQRRACHVFAFGGSDEVAELALQFDSLGLERLGQFLGQSFRGGTDLCAPLERVLAKLEQTHWQRADLLIASDGEFGAPPELVARLDAARQTLGLRVQGVLIGDRETLGLRALCDHIYPVRHWRHFGGQPVESPVHTPELTALYFPGALRSPTQQPATVSGDALASAVRAGLLRGGTP